jgi:hypothetical protein
MTCFKLVAIPALVLFAANHVAAQTYGAPLTGAAEVPAVSSPGTGGTTVVYDSTQHTLTIDISFSGLVGTTTASHIHCCVPPGGNAPVATTTPKFVGFPSGVTSGTYHIVLDLTLPDSWNAPFITANGGTPAGAEAALAAGLNAGNAYLNIHTTVNPGGEIRGFLNFLGPDPFFTWFFFS